VASLITGVTANGVASGFLYQYFIAGLLILMFSVAIFVIRKFKRPALCYSIVPVALAMLVGAGYFFAFDYAKKDARIIFDEKVQFAGVIREHKRAEVQAIGAGAVNQAVKAWALATGYLKLDGIEVVCVPEFVEVTIEDKVRTAIKFVIEPR